MLKTSQILLSRTPHSAANAFVTVPQSSCQILKFSHPLRFPPFVPHLHGSIYSQAFVLKVGRTTRGVALGIQKELAEITLDPPPNCRNDNPTARVWTSVQFGSRIVSRIAVVFESRV
ncbi:uncharacterized [Tachysurus ichikawai]